MGRTEVDKLITYMTVSVGGLVGCGNTDDGAEMCAYPWDSFINEPLHYMFS